ncbi:MAG: hypothetical protein FWG71_03030 [Synergistaceae bacterium]|nr:hypothetical protein [Synergistaceae bacterium]
MWNRDTNWRQGSVIKVETLRNYNPGLVRNLAEDVVYLCVVSNDGDIINDNVMLEPVVEFVDAKLIAAPHPAYTNAKHPSILHLTYLLDGEKIMLELKASPKLGLSKHNLVPALQPDERFSLDEAAKSTLQAWMSFRYRRRDLPRAFVARTMPIWNYLKKEGKKYATHAMGYWVNYDPRGEELAGNVPYLFSLYIVYSNRHHDAREQSEKLALEIRNRFPDWQEAVKETGEIEMHECRAYGEDCFTLSDLQNCIHFNLDQAGFISEPFRSREAEDSDKA